MAPPVPAAPRGGYIPCLPIHLPSTGSAPWSGGVDPATKVPEADGFAAPAIAEAAGEKRARRRLLPPQLPVPNYRIAECRRRSGSLVPLRARTRTRWIRISPPAKIRWKALLQVSTQDQSRALGQ